MSSSQAPKKNPFCKSQDKRQGKERAIRVSFLAATYFILLCAIGIFGNIIWNGFPVLRDKGLDFITKKPQTLNVTEVEKKDDIVVPASNFDSILNSNANKEDLITNVKDIEKTFDFVEFTIEPGSIIGEGYLKLLEQENEGFYLRYDDRDKNATIAFTLDQEKVFTLKQAEFDSFKQNAPELVPADVPSRESTLKEFAVTIAAGEYSIGKDVHDALVPTPLIFQMRQTFADDDAGKIYQTVIPKTQTITVSSGVYYTVFDEDESSTPLPFTEKKDIPIKTVFHDVKIPAGTYSISPEALAILASKGVQTKHNVEAGSIVFNNDKPVELTFPVHQLAELKANNPHLKITNERPFTESEKYISFSIAKDTELRLDVDDYEALTIANSETGNFSTTSEKTHSYSGGGVWGPIVGTALLVFICMAIALFTGISTSIYLNEYANQGGFIKAIRLAMLNLAGVPSIVFGLFGLGLFVILAPKMTSTPNAESKIIVPIVAGASEPGAREVEERAIYVSESSTKVSELKKASAAENKSLFYDGWYYLSFQGWGTCMLAGGFTLAIMVLPVIITSCEESLSAVPMGFREASLALGATKWQSIRTAVLPYAFPGILTASILGITRVAGETAPIMFTAAVADRSGLPWEGLHQEGFGKFIQFLEQSVQALPYHIYTVAGRIPQSEYTEPMQYGSVLVFMIIVMTFAAFSVWLRIRIRNKIKW